MSSPQIYPLSLHDALPIFGAVGAAARELPVHARVAAHREGAPEPGRRLRYVQLLPAAVARRSARGNAPRRVRGDRKSTRLNSSHLGISYAVFCLKKKNKTQ